MLFYSFHEIAVMLIAAIVLDLMIGDPVWLPHPVVVIGKGIRLLEKRLLGVQGGEQHANIAGTSKRGKLNSMCVKVKGLILTLVIVGISSSFIWGLLWFSQWIHPWFGYVVNTWFISTTIAIKGLKDAANLVYRPLREHRLADARKYVGYIVGRDTAALSEQEVVRATVETVAENIVDAVVSPLFYAFLGAAPLAMMYRASNTLDSMVGYKNEKYIHFGWASARWDDVLNWLPARLTGLLLIVQMFFYRQMSALRAWNSIRHFASLHPSPNSGIPESAVAGALGIELGGRNYYGGVASDRARMGWPLRPIEQGDIPKTVRILYGTGYMLAGGLICVLFVV